MTDLRQEMRQLMESMEGSLEPTVEINQEMVQEAFDILFHAGLMRNPSVQITESEEGCETVRKMVEALDSAAYLLRQSVNKQEK